jgi:predicted 3-demethylubiquinone-9 3-methyltransferase (glyoxalase superfamily)
LLWRRAVRIQRKLGEKKMPASICPFLMFEGNAEAAINFYASLFPGSEVNEIVRYATGEPGPEGTVKLARFTVAGQMILASDSFVKHAFSFTPATSLFVECESEGEIDRIYAALCNGGSALMPIENYGFSRRFAWVNDRFGVSWQLNLI